LQNGSHLQAPFQRTSEGAPIGSKASFEELVVEQVQKGIEP